jgi:hypothetical protein
MAAGEAIPTRAGVLEAETKQFPATVEPIGSDTSLNRLRSVRCSTLGPTEFTQIDSIRGPNVIQGLQHHCFAEGGDGSDQVRAWGRAA